MNGESDDEYEECWPVFRDRVVAALQRILDDDSKRLTAVFTSGGPIGTAIQWVCAHACARVCAYARVRVCPCALRARARVYVCVCTCVCACACFRQSQHDTTNIMNPRHLREREFPRPGVLTLRNRADAHF